jgi:hypothetical protein
MLRYAACLELGRGVPKDEKAALIAYEEAAQRGSSVAMNNIGQMVREGRGQGKDAAFAASWFRYVSQVARPTLACCAVQVHVGVKHMAAPDMCCPGDVMWTSSPQTILGQLWAPWLLSPLFLLTMILMPAFRCNQCTSSSWHDSALPRMDSGTCSRRLCTCYSR